MIQLDYVKLFALGLNHLIVLVVLAIYAGKFLQASNSHNNLTFWMAT